MANKESAEMYLETMLILSKEKEYVRSVDVAERMGFTKPSISRAVGLLKKHGYIEVNDLGAITLTESGSKIAESIYERHMTLTKVLMSLGVNEAVASEDACRIEHYISDESFEAIKRFLNRPQNKDI